MGGPGHITFEEDSDALKDAPVHELPNDILSYIFLLNANLPGASCVSRAATTTASSQVCVKWRLVALRYHTIWGCIIDYTRHSLQWVEALLCRSSPSLFNFGSPTLPIDLTGHREGELRVLELVFNHISRVRIFNLQAHISSWELVRSRFLLPPAPHLEFMGFTVLFEPGRVVADPLFAGYAPRLRTLQLHRCAIDFASPILTSLTELYVNQITALNAGPTSFGWLNILGGMPSLRWLTIIYAISPATPHTALPVIHLVDLEMLSIEGGFHESVALVDQLITPPCCGLRLRCDDAQLGFDQRRLWAIIEKKLEIWAKDPPNRPLYVINEENNVSIGNTSNFDCEWEAGGGMLCGDRELPLDPALSISLYSLNSQETLSLFPSLFSLFEPTFSTTTYLRLWMDYESSDGTGVFIPVINSFGSFRNLHALDLLHDSHSFLFPLPECLSSPGSILLPSLHTVAFFKAHFRPRSESLPVVAAFLQWRREQGFPIRKIDIIESSISRDYINSELRDVEVDMDTWNLWESESEEEELD